MRQKLNTERFQGALLNEVLPMAEKTYHISADQKKKPGHRGSLDGRPLSHSP